jgi:hypothetical protein
MEKEVKRSQLRDGPIVHPVLPDSVVERIKAFKEMLGDVDRASLAETIDAFKRDAHPENELLVWERIASTFQMFLVYNLTNDPAIRRDIFGVLVGASTGMETCPRVKHLSDQQIRHLVLNYQGLYE